MKYATIFLLLTLSCYLNAQHTYIFSKEEICTSANIGNCQSKNPTQLSFLKEAEKTFNDPKDRKNIILVTPPLEWGKEQFEYTSGGLNYKPTFKDGFIADIKLEGLLPDHTYVLTLNGRPDLDGNILLPDTVPGLPNEKYYDFLQITTDSKGQYTSGLAILLQPGPYHVRLYVKDTDDFKIVLYHDYFKFIVE